MRIYLQQATDQTDVHRARLRYAFSLFCAVYGHQLIFQPEQAAAADVWLSYLTGPTGGNVRPTLVLSDLYQPRSPSEPAPPPIRFKSGDAGTVLFCSPSDGREPDWLGEIFEWVSCADEYSITKRDSMGGIPYADSYVRRHNLDMRLPYAAIAMRFLQRALCALVPGSPVQPVSPVPSVRHFVIGTHDVDFLPLSFLSSVHRLSKNAAASALYFRSPTLALKQAGQALLTVVGGKNPLDQVPHLVAQETQRGIRATYFFLAGQRHRRDGNYLIDQPAVVHLMRSLERQGMEVGVHGSYTSLDDPQDLIAEFAHLRRLGFRATGGRQHWLRFTLNRLIPALESAQAQYDSSLGWNEATGFRGGACFPFPPYNFEQERPATFLEIPMVAMDASLLVEKISEESWFSHLAELLFVSRRYGWGGISLIWHPTAFGGGQLPLGIGEVFWKLLDHREQWGDTWVCAADFVRSVYQRYVDVGLLPATTEHEPAQTLHPH